MLTNAYLLHKAAHAPAYESNPLSSVFEVPRWWRNRTTSINWRDIYHVALQHKTPEDNTICYKCYTKTPQQLGLLLPT